jgi:type I restriction enzyme S subunit
MSRAQQLITENIATWTGAIQAKSASGRGSSNKYELYGIKKLRELILELAVRGKLVPQDSSDEPASVLLERIAVEKAELIKAKKIKKPKALPPISDEEKPFELPEGWEWSRLGFLASYGNQNKAEPNTVHENTWVLELEDVEKGTSRLLHKVRFSERKFKSTKNIFTPNDVLYGKLRPYLDKVLVADENGVCTTEIVPISCHSGIFPYYLRYYLKSPRFIEYANESTHGMNLPRLGTDKAIQTLIPVAPINEQHRIVQKVDELMALCDQLEQQTESSIEAHGTLVDTLLATLTNSADADELQQNWGRIAGHFDTLFTTERSIDALKQTILQLAVMGKLVRQNPDDEPASVLLKRIAVEKDRLVKEKKLKKEKALPDINDNEMLFELPAGWDWCRLDALSLSSEAGWSPQCEPTPREGDNWGVLKVSAVTWGSFNPEENKALPKGMSPRTQYEVKNGDFLISRANTAELVARAVVVPADTPSHLMMSDKIIRFTFSTYAVSEYINLVNSCNYSREYYAAVAGGTSSSMKNVSRNQIRGLAIPLPPFNEQHRIIAKVDELMALCEQLKNKLRQSQQTQLHLTDAIVEQALN